MACQALGFPGGWLHFGMMGTEDQNERKEQVTWQLLA